MKKEGLNILMVEDNEFDAELNQEQLLLLDDFDCTIKVIKDKDVYINEISSSTLPDLILCDYNLPMFNGMDALHELNSRKLLIPFIFVTGTMQEEIAADAIKSGAWDYVVKDRLFRLPLAIKSALNLKKERETAKKAEEKTMRLIESIDQTTMQVIITDQNNIIEYVNKKVCAVTGYSSDEMIGKPAELFGFQENNPETQEKIKLSIERGEGFKGELLGCYKSNEKCYELVTITPIKNKLGELTSIIIIKEDITERKQLEEYLKKTLEGQQTLNKELVLAKNKAEESDNLKTAFLANLSHEIRTPMNGILGFTDLLKNRNLSFEKVNQYIDIIQHSGNRLIHIIEDLIDISKIEANQITTTPKETDLHELFDGICHFFKPQAEQKGLTFTCEKEFINAVNIFIDKLKLEQVLSNILNNALKFTDEGTIHFKYYVADDQIYFSIKDTGIGISSDMKQLIFKRFRQVENTHFKATEGMGIGLSISKSFVEKMGGEIWVESELGIGSEFIVKLPFQKIEEEKNQLFKTEQAFEKGINLLVAEDDEINYLYLSEMLSDKNINLFHAINGEKAIQSFNEHPNINIILMDLKMPILNGIDATCEIRKKNTQIPIIALTAYTSDQDKKAALNAGCTDFISKPVRRELLLEKITNALNSS